jgi:hypothetical protein
MKHKSMDSLQKRYSNKVTAPQALHGPAQRTAYEIKQRGIGHDVATTHGAHNTKTGYPGKAPASKPVAQGKTGGFDAEVNDYRSGYKGGRGLQTEITRDDYKSGK